MSVVYISIGNSDDRLSQLKWASYIHEFRAIMRLIPTEILGDWYSAPDSPYQNACIAAVPDAGRDRLRQELELLRTQYDQKSIAWAECPETEFL
ncbi:hypothetical protein [Amycolatopsis sp. NPDC021455]|uniref:hypothetical protein n=1 Tax=Amycolatopsis sp. NPDC021455 TaxID=3154901 RepID=UPI0033E2ADC7